jgi:hypothetical protein
MGWTLDFTTMQMVLTLRLTSFAFNYYDGNREPAVIFNFEFTDRIAESFRGSTKTISENVAWASGILWICVFLLFVYGGSRY